MSWIIIGITTGICLLIGIFMIWPGLSTDWKTYQETKTAQKNLTDLTEKKKVLSALSQNKNLDEITKNAASYIPEEAKSSELILELSAIIGQAGLSLDQISLENVVAAKPTQEDSDDTSKTNTTTTTKKGPAEVVDFSLKISGGFANLMQFFTLTETSSRLIVIQNLSLAQEKEKISAIIKGQAYWNKVNTKTEKTLDNVTVTSETLQKFSDLRQYATPLDTSAESGFGRTNPFDTVK
jgi:Tfp pilus assembly protein PilO